MTIFLLAIRLKTSSDSAPSDPGQQLSGPERPVFCGLKVMADEPGFIEALKEAKLGLSEGGLPIGACIVSQDGKVLGSGHNMRIQKGSATLHAEIAALENGGRLRANVLKGATMYTTLSPCDMCTGACILYKMARVVVGENKNFLGGEEYLRQRGIEVTILNDAECEALMGQYIHEHPQIWNEDIGE